MRRSKIASSKLALGKYKEAILMEKYFQGFLTGDFIRNLCISRGTLTPEERAVIQNHMQITINMLEKLPFPRHLRRVPRFAGGHHETMIGTGYPSWSSKRRYVCTSSYDGNRGYFRP